MIKNIAQSYNIDIVDLRLIHFYETFEDTNVIIRSRKSTDNTIIVNGQIKRTKAQTMMYKTVHRKPRLVLGGAGTHKKYNHCCSL